MAFSEVFAIITYIPSFILPSHHPPSNYPSFSFIPLCHHAPFFLGSFSPPSWSISSFLNSVDILNETQMSKAKKLTSTHKENMCIRYSYLLLAPLSLFFCVSPPCLHIHKQELT